MMLFQTRLGPKPFSTETTDISFDKVFSVPTAPTTNETEQSRQIVEENEEVPPPEEVFAEKVSFSFEF
jgi:coronin-7